MDDHRQSGYTLFELMLTLTLVSVFAMLATPSFSHQIELSRLRSATEIIAADFRHSRIKAIQTGKTQYINFQKSDSQWCYSKAPDNPKPCNNSGSSSNDFGGVQLSKLAFGKKPIITFSPIRGITRNGRLTLVTASGLSASIIVSPLGRIRICSANAAGFSSC